MSIGGKNFRAGTGGGKGTTECSLIHIYKGTVDYLNTQCLSENTPHLHVNIKHLYHN